MSPLRNGIYTAEFKYDMSGEFPWKFRIFKEGKPVNERLYGDGWDSRPFSFAWTCKRRARLVLRRLRKADRMNGGWHK